MSPAIISSPDRIKENPLHEYDPLADLYDLEYVHTYDLRFWLALAGREPGPVVEWGAGTGRIAIPLADAGHEVTAVEVSGGMVGQGREKSSAAGWTVGDMRSAKLGRGYGLAICAFNSFLCLPSMEDALDFLRNAREHLEPGGLLGIEVSAFSPEELLDPPGGPELQHDFTRSLPDGRLDRFSVTRHDAASRIMEMSLIYEIHRTGDGLQDRRAHELKIRIFDRTELESMLKSSGFEVEAVYGGFDGGPFTSTSDHLIVLARNPVVR